MDHEKFKNMASGFQSIAIGIAVIVGGFWSFYLLNVELRVENAQANLKKLDREIQEKE